MLRGTMGISTYLLDFQIVASVEQFESQKLESVYRVTAQL